jgi:hypothetical protein
VGQYRAGIHQVRLSLDHLMAGRPPSNASLRPMADTLAGLARVRLPGGGTISTDAPAWASSLRSGSATGRRRVAKRIDALDDALGRARPAPLSRTAAGKLDAILREPRFQHEQSLPERILQWVEHLLLRALQTILASNGGVGPAIRLLFVVLLLGLVAVVAYLLARRSLGQLVAEVETTDEAGEPMISTSAAERASQLAASGDYRTALRYLYLATLLQLQERGALQLRPGRTNREYVRMLEVEGVDSDVRAALAALTEQFDRVWYGHLPFGAGDFARCEGLARRALAVPRPERVA